MRKPRLYKSEMLLEEFVKKSNTNVIIQYIRSLNNYIEFLESQCDIDDDDDEAYSDKLEDGFHDAEEN